MKKAGTNCLPVVQRELREGARRPFNYWLRVGGAAAGVWLLFVLGKRDQYRAMEATGLHLFTSLHQMMLALICLIVPAISAECISREKREGTLGLLFLTPLTALGIVVGKGLVQMFRAFTLWLAVLPVLVIPFLFGGVTGTDVISAITIEFCVTLLCLSAGVLASSLAKARNTAFLLAACLTVCFLCIFGALLGVGLNLQTGNSPTQLVSFFQAGQTLLTGQADSTSTGGLPVASSGIYSLSPIAIRTGPIGIQYAPTTQTVTRIGPNGARIITWTTSLPSVTTTYIYRTSSYGWAGKISTSAIRAAWHSVLLESLLAVPLVFYLVLRLAAHLMADSWKDKGPSLRRESWIKTYCVPIARERFTRKLQRLLDWNPIAWLQLHSWKAGIIRWGLCLFFVLLEAPICHSSPAKLLQFQTTFVLIMAGIYSFVSVNGFLTEKKSGALELLLVTPVSPDEIIFGRVWGLWLQFLPSALALLFCWWDAEYLASSNMPNYSPSMNPNSGMLWNNLTMLASWGIGQDVSAWGQIHLRPLNELSNPEFQVFVIAVGFFTLPVFATYFALRVKNLWVAAALTWLALLLCPYFAFTLLGALAIMGDVSLVSPLLCGVVFLTNFAFALLACFLLRHSLSRRIYSF